MEQLEHESVTVMIDSIGGIAFGTTIPALDLFSFKQSIYLKGEITDEG